MLSESMNQHFKTYKWKFLSKIIQQNPIMWRISPGNVFHWSFMISVSWCSLLCQWSFRGGKGILWTLQWLDVALHFCFAQMLRAKCWGFQKSTLSMEHVPKGGRNTTRWWVAIKDLWLQNSCSNCHCNRGSQMWEFDANLSNGLILEHHQVTGYDGG